MGINPANVRVFGYGGAVLEQDFSLPKQDDLPELAIWMEKGSDGMGYNSWFYDRLFLMGGAQKYATDMIKSFQEFPPRQKPGSFTISDVSALIEQGAKSN